MKDKIIFVLKKKKINRLSKSKSDWLVNEYLTNSYYESNLEFILNEHFGTMSDEELKERYDEAKEFLKRRKK